MFQDGAAVYDALRVSDEKEEIKNGEVRSYNSPKTVSDEFSSPLTQNFELTECVECTGDSVEDIIVLARLEPTYEVRKLSFSAQLSLRWF
jgi:hypothetical protein